MGKPEEDAVARSDSRGGRSSSPLAATPSTVRAINDRAALELLVGHGTLSRKQLADLTGLSKPTTAQLLQRLEDAGLIVPRGTSSGAPGPRAQLYALNERAAFVAAVDVDEHRVAVAVADLAGTVVGQAAEAVDYTGPDDPVPSVRRVLGEACRLGRLRLRDLDHVVLGIPAAYDPGADRLAFADHIPGWARPETLTRLRAVLRADVVVANDVKLAAVWERAHGVARDVSSFALLWAGTGLGLAIDFDGTLYTGATGGAGEIGYMRLGRRPARGDDLPPMFNDLLGIEAVTALADEHGLPTEPGAAVAAARDDLGAGMPFLSELARRIADGLGPIVAVLDPPLVVLAGPTCSPGGEVLAQLVGEQLRAASPFEARLAVSTGRVGTGPGGPVLQGGLDFGLTRLRARLFGDVPKVGGARQQQEA